jgi:Na+-transporting NADH:ubiquinone oxidoreductase subunit NqrF
MTTHNSNGTNISARVNSNGSTTLFIDNGMTNVEHWSQVVVTAPTVATTFRYLLEANPDTDILALHGNRAAFNF